MKLGVSSSVFLHRDINQALNIISNLDFSYVELWGEPPHLWIRYFDKKEIIKLKKLLEKLKLKNSYHAPSHGLDLSSVNPGIWEESLRQHLEAIKAASILNSEVFVIHSGSYYTGDRPESESGKDRFYRALEAILKEAEKRKIKIGLENYPVGNNSILSSADKLKTVLEDFSSKYLRATLDVGHAYLNGEDPVDYLNILKKEIINIHLSDNFGKEDLHLKPGEGDISFPAIFKAIREIEYSELMTLEIWEPESPEKAIAESRKYLINLCCQ